MVQGEPEPQDSRSEGYKSSKSRTQKHRPYSTARKLQAVVLTIRTIPKIVIAFYDISKSTGQHNDEYTRTQESGLA